MHIKQAISVLIIVYSFLSIKITSAEEINIGVILPLTGPTAEWGIEANRALDIFRRTKIEGIDKINFEVEDGKCGQGNSAVSSIQHLIANKRVVAVVSGCSGEVLQIAPILENRKIPTVCVLCGNPAVKNAGEFIFRAYPDLEQGASLLSNYILKNNFLKIAIITETNSFTSSIRAMLEKKLANRIIVSEELNPEEINYSSAITKIKSKILMRYI